MWILFGYHVFLIFTNQTTNEYLKKYRKNHPKNPFHNSLVKNLKKFCTSRTKKGHFGHSVYKERPNSYNNIVATTEKNVIVSIQDNTAPDYTPNKALGVQDY